MPHDFILYVQEEVCECSITKYSVGDGTERLCLKPGIEDLRYEQLEQVLQLWKLKACRDMTHTYLCVSSGIRNGRWRLEYCIHTTS